MMNGDENKKANFKTTPKQKKSPFINKFRMIGGDMGSLKIGANSYYSHEYQNVCRHAIGLHFNWSL